MAGFCKKCRTGTSSRLHRTKCLKQATLANVADDWEAMRKLLAKTTEQIIRLEETVGILVKAMCRESRLNSALTRMQRMQEAKEK